MRFCVLLQICYLCFHMFFFFKELVFRNKIWKPLCVVLYIPSAWQLARAAARGHMSHASDTASPRATPDFPNGALEMWSWDYIFSRWSRNDQIMRWHKYRVWQGRIQSWPTSVQTDYRSNTAVILLRRGLGNWVQEFWLPRHTFLSRSYCVTKLKY